MRRWELKADKVHVGVTEMGGQLDPVRFSTEHGWIAPMHVAPWSDEPLDPSVPPMLRNLRGDFFCAPFGDSDLTPEETRPHGATANDRWQLVSVDAEQLELELSKPVLGARVRKRVSVRPGHPVVYQEHVFEGGVGELPLGHHAMLRVPEEVRLSFSRWIWAGTPPTPVESVPSQGRSLLKYPQKIDNLAQVKLADGTLVDLTRYPILHEHEDLLMLVSDPDLPFAWSAVTAPTAQWVWFALKAPQTLRNTVLWLSNGGRHYPPFSGRHTRVLGVEEVTAYFHLGHRASVNMNPLRDQGYATTAVLEPRKPLSIRYVFGLVGTPPGFSRVETIEAVEGGIVIKDPEGTFVHAPVDVAFINAKESA